MSVAYHAVGWNRQKLRYDFGLAVLLLASLTTYAAITFTLRPATTAETFVIRFTAIAALVVLHLILAIGPLARLDHRFIPLLYNRRHLGVTMFLLALIHGAFSIVQFHAGGDKNPLVSVLTAYRQDYLSGNLPQFPFEALGLAALAILFVMAATSHDFWLRNLGASFWKTLHLFVYLAYGLIVAHVCLGALQSERSPALALLLATGFLLITVLHLAAFLREQRLDLARRQARSDGLVRIDPSEFPAEGAGGIITVSGRRLALFRQEGRLFAVSNVCRHQGGPLGEGRIVNGCVTCPWHGYQYRANDGCSPPPFTEVVPTHALRIIDGDVFISPNPLPLRANSQGVPCPVASNESPAADFYIGWQGSAAVGSARFTRHAFFAALLAACAATGIAAWFQAPVDAGEFQFGVIRTFTGNLHENPLPLLQVSGGPSPAGRNFLLVGAGKFGPPAEIRGHEGAVVEFKGSLIARRGVAMIEMNDPASFKVRQLSPPGAGPETPRALGTGTYVGELVDTKCFLGVMRPATGKVHRGCAVRCLSGGVPPGLLVRDEAGNGAVLMLVGPDGSPLSIPTNLAARILEVRGELSDFNGTSVLRVATWRLRE